ncbi:hypothetical protein KSP40_PGU008393 [Platanthera guangdongensis]|uniref:Uncharacterized protein n=1 Tax=Platanthera guangdongensis TaxID=2320717 RepID=A0ABR2M2C9_9ASPA
MQLQQSTDTRWVQYWDPRAQSSEQILFLKLRIHFADFPCLHCSIDQRLFTLETWCGYEYDRVWTGLDPPDFHGPPGKREVTLSDGLPPSLRIG